MTKLSAEAYAIIEGRHSDPFHYLGLHTEGDRTVVRAFLPEAVERRGDRRARRSRRSCRASTTPACSPAPLPNGSKRYQLRARFGDTVVELDDPYRFPPILSDFDLYLLGEGTHQRLYDKLGAHPMTLDGVDGVAFVVLAPNARRVSVVGDFNFWDRRGGTPMRVRGDGYWEIFVPAPRAGDHYKFEIIGPHGQHAAAEIRSDGLCRGDAPEHRLDRVRRGQAAASAAGAGAASTRWARRSRSTRCISAPGGARATTSG